jgi:bifunctional ADP-heptose synthase (sugar kinase/adenylyltransferase)
VNEWPSIAECIRLLKPDVYVKSRDSVDSPGPIAEDVYDEEAALASVGGRIHYCEDFATSSTHLLNAYFDVFPPETSEYLQRFRQRFSANDVIGLLKSLANVRVLVVGDAILDEYFFCRPYGMASKSSIIAAQFLNEQIYLGGALAVANHVAGFCSNVHLVACLGEKESRKEFIEQHLKPNVSTRFLFRPDAPTLIKRRYVHSFLVTKLFEVSYFNDQPLAADLDAELCESLTKVIRDYDLVLVADFGHGFLSPKAIEIVCRMANYLAVNAQLNSINTGYNLITKYPRADYICIDEEEVRMACRDRYGPIEELVAKLSREMGTKLTTVTRSYRGSLTYHPDKGFVSVPVLSREVVDTMGAGDAYLSVTSPCACMGFPPEIIGFVGNAVGALAVRIIGNKESVEPPALFKFLDSLLR